MNFVDHKIETARLYLFPPRLKDKACLCQLWQLEAVQRYMGGILSAQASEAKMVEILKTWEQKDVGLWAVFKKEGKEGNELLGLCVCGIGDFEGKSEVIYKLFPQYWGAGFATEASFAVLNYAFGTLHLDCMAGITQELNTTSQRVLISTILQNEVLINVFMKSAKHNGRVNREIIMRSEIKEIVVRLIEEKYMDAAAVFWAGSIPTGDFTNSSDLDIVVVFDQIPNAYRETFLYEDWKVDAFIHDLETLHYFFEEIDRKSGMPALPMMIAEGILMIPPSPLSEKIKQLASKIIKQGPPQWTQSDIDKARFFITDLLDDARGSLKRSEQIASAAKLYDLLGEFYFRAQNKWQASGKILLRYLKKQNYALAERYRDAFDEVFKYGHTKELESLVKEILKPYGGLLWEDYRMDAPATWRISSNLCEK